MLDRFGTTGHSAYSPGHGEDRARLPGDGGVPRAASKVTARSKGRRLLWWTAIGLATAALVLAAPYGAAELRIRMERRAWSRDDPAGAAAIGRQPTAPANGTARELVERLRPLGLDLRAGHLADEELSALAQAIESEGRRSDDHDGRPALPERYREALTGVEDLLLGAEPPDWPRNVRSFDPPLPPIVGLRALNALLLARALERDGGGDVAGTDRALQASSRLEVGLRDRTERMSQVAAAALARARAGVLRRLVHPPEGWRDRLGAHDFRSSFAAAYQMEARIQMEYARRRRFAWTELTGGRSSGLPDWSRPADRLVTTAFARWCAADASRRLRATAAALRAVEPCRADPVALEQAATRDAPRWNLVARATLPGAAAAWLSVADVELQEELTRVVLETRALRPAGPDSTASRVCSGLVWTRTPDAAGAVTVAPAGVALPARRGGVPWSYRVAAPAGQR